MRSTLFLCATFALLVATSSGAIAETASFSSSATLSDNDVAALSMAGDNAGAVLALNESLSLIFDAPFATETGDAVTIASVPPPRGSQAFFTIQVGVFNGGDPIIVSTRRSARAGGALTLNNLFQRGCSAFGGCDYIEIITTRVGRDQTGAEIDYVDINGDVVGVTAATPEPGTWGLMIAGFILVAWRAKHLRNTTLQIQPAIKSGSAT